MGSFSDNYYKKADREELRPAKVICPEGIWITEASLLFLEKERGNSEKKMTMVEIMNSFSFFLLKNTGIEVFTISSYSGEKEALGRNILRSSYAATHLSYGHIPYMNNHKANGDGRYIFVNREQFEDYLNDRPFLKTCDKQQGIISHPEKSLGTRERETLLKLIAGMAVDGYGYDPKASKSPVPKEIESSLSQLGISITDDTIRKWLKEAAELLPKPLEKPRS